MHIVNIIFHQVLLAAVVSVCSAAPSVVWNPGWGAVGVAGPQVGPAVVSGAVAGPVKVSGAVAGPAVVTGSVAGPSAVVGAVAGPTLVTQPGLGAVVVGEYQIILSCTKLFTHRLIG